MISTRFENAYLHSSMERLKGAKGGLTEADIKGFTFQYGEIKSGAAVEQRTGLMRFTFQYGEIKSHCARTISFFLMLFTFQYGEIKSVADFFFQGSDEYLHSSMERLKVPRASALNRSECEFTFQYGEIKSGAA